MQYELFPRVQKNASSQEMIGDQQPDPELEPANFLRVIAHGWNQAGFCVGFLSASTALAASFAFLRSSSSRPRARKSAKITPFYSATTMTFREGKGLGSGEPRVRRSQTSFQISPLLLGNLTRIGQHHCSRILAQTQIHFMPDVSIQGFWLGGFALETLHCLMICLVGSSH